MRPAFFFIAVAVLFFIHAIPHHHSFSRDREVLRRLLYFGSRAREEAHQDRVL